MQDSFVIVWNICSILEFPFPGRLLYESTIMRKLEVLSFKSS